MRYRMLAWMLGAGCVVGTTFFAFRGQPARQATDMPQSSVQSHSVSTIDFSRDVLPILSGKCFACHGHDRQARKAGLRLDRREFALKPAKSGETPIRPGDSAASELVRRICAEDETDRMPPVKGGKKLSVREKELLKRWIDEGAEFKLQWAFVKPRRSVPPDVKNQAWVKNEIDRFILHRLEEAGLTPAPEADRVTLIRRLSLDLRGLPPSLEEIDAFLVDASPDAYEKLVERMLDSPHFGEKMAQTWLDLARFGDTSGYHFDSTRQMWLWRDWVINAFNKNMPFDQFTIEQLAGDLLPGATVEQKIASGFNRNTRFNEEGGVDPEEYVIRYNVDRTNTLGQVWLGLTLGCAECHDHKYDPITQNEYYQLYAYFTGIAEPMKSGNHDVPLLPILKLPAPEQVKAIEEVRLDLAIVKKAIGKATGEAVVPLEQDAEELTKKLKQLEDAVPYTLVSEEMPTPREAYVLIRGDFLHKGEKVERGVPASLPALPAGAPKNRLGLARWLVGTDQPLTARVQVNRFWEQMFSEGIVRTPGDFGSQGEYPTHPELLDWLASEFGRTWDTKELLRTIALSATYRQSSVVRADVLKVDPANRLLARAPRRRLSAEEIRDGALAVAGLLNRRIGGPSFMPYQPVDYYQGKNENWVWRASSGEDQYRRGVYAFWRRNSLHPMFALLDAPTREDCCVQRARTNTPLQALVTLNDPSLLEAARVFAERLLTDGPKNLNARLTFLFRSTTCRMPADRELDVLRRRFHQQQQRFQGDPGAAANFVNAGQYPRDAGLDVVELASWTALANMMLNLDEVLTRE